MANPRIRLETIVSPKTIPTQLEPRSVTVVLHVIAPGVDEGVQARPLNIGLLIDRSGSMRGPKIDTARAAAIRVVRQLADDDVFSLITFHDQYDIVVPATKVRDQREEIIERIRQIEAGGRTYLAEALNSANVELRPFFVDGRVSTVYVLTDGVVKDAEACKKLRAAFESHGVSLRGGGIGADYNHEFLDELCIDPLGGNTKYLVEHIELDNLNQDLASNFEEFLHTKGHVVTSDCRLAVQAPPNRAQLKSAIAEEHSKTLTAESDQTFKIADLPAGGYARYKFEFDVICKTPGDLQLANFLLNYRMGGKNDSASVPANLAIRNGAQAIHEPEVVDLVTRIKVVKMREQAEQSLKEGKIREATRLLRKSTQSLRKTNQMALAEQTLREIEEIEAQAAPADLLEKRIREGTRQMKPN